MNFLLKPEDQIMGFDPTTGAKNPFPSHAAQYRAYHGGAAWLFNPWSGDKRHVLDIGSDPFFLACFPNTANCQDGAGNKE